MQTSGAPCEGLLEPFDMRQVIGENTSHPEAAELGVWTA